MRQGIQTFYAEAGEAACYALSLINVAGEYLKQEIDPDNALIAGINNKMIHYSWDDRNDNNNFFVDKPADYLLLMTGRNWSVRKEGADYIPKSNEFTIVRWERAVTGVTYGHFRRPNWDSLVDSQTVKYGKIVSYRICTPL